MMASACSFDGGGDASAVASDAVASLESSEVVEELAMTDEDQTGDAHTDPADDAMTDDAPTDDALADEPTTAEDDPAEPDDTSSDDGEDEATEAASIPAVSIPAAPAELAWLSAMQRTCLQDELSLGDDQGASFATNTSNQDKTELMTSLLSCVSFGEVSRQSAGEQGVALGFSSVRCINEAVSDAEISTTDLGRLVAGTASARTRTEVTATMLGCLSQTEREGLAAS